MLYQARSLCDRWMKPSSGASAMWPAPSCHSGEWQGPTPLWASDGSSLGNLTLASGFQGGSEVSETSVPNSKWAIDEIHACLLACKNSSLCTFVDGQRNGDESFCAGVVLAEPTHTPQEQLSCNTAVQHTPTAPVPDHSRCYQQVERLSPQDSQLGTGQPALHRRLLNECDLKATAISLLGCRTGYAATAPPLPATLAASPQSPFIYPSKPPLEDPLNPTWLGANPEGGANPAGGPLSWVWPLSHLSLCILLVVPLARIVLLYRHLSRRAAHLRLSRDRAQSDLQLLAHQVSRVQAGTGDEHCSLGGSLSDEWPACLALPPPRRSFGWVSPPPGPPTSSSDESVLEQDQAASPAWAEADRRELGERAGGSSSEQKAAVPLSWAEADRQFYADQAAKAQMEKKLPAGELPLEQTAPLAAAAFAAEALADLSAKEAGPSTATTGPPQGASPGVAPSPTRTSSTPPCTITSSTKRAPQDEDQDLQG